MHLIIHSVDKAALDEYVYVFMKLQRCNWHDARVDDGVM